MSGAADFHIAAFAPDGALEGRGTRNVADLSEKWIGFCRSLIDANGLVFDRLLTMSLAHIGIKCSGIHDAALVTISVHDRTQTTFALIRSDSKSATQVLAMFVDSVRRNASRQQLAPAAAPFGEMLGIEERPLMALVIWCDPAISDQDNDLVRELGLHFAAAFFAL